MNLIVQIALHRDGDRAGEGDCVPLDPATWHALQRLPPSRPAHPASHQYLFRVLAPVRCRPRTLSATRTNELVAGLDPKIV